ncbi:MAG: hypothetical protein RIR00_354 [Pseudomonadota bacterium]
MAPVTPASSPSFDAERKYVRICRTRSDGFIEFEFAIGSPELSIELLLPEAAFHEFCLNNGVIVLEPQTAPGDWVARSNAAALQGFQDAV